MVESAFFEIRRTSSKFSPKVSRSQVAASRLGQGKGGTICKASTSLLLKDTTTQPMHFAIVSPASTQPRISEKERPNSSDGSTRPSTVSIATSVEWMSTTTRADENSVEMYLNRQANHFDPSGLAVPVIGAIAGGVVGAVSGGSGAILQGGSASAIAGAALIGAIAGATTGAVAGSVVFLGLTSVLADAVGQLIGSLSSSDCNASNRGFSPASVAAAFAAGVTSGGMARMLSLTPGFAGQSAIVQEAAKALTGLATTPWPLVAGALDPFAQPNR